MSLSNNNNGNENLLKKHKTAFIISTTLLVTILLTLVIVIIIFSQKSENDVSDTNNTSTEIITENNNESTETTLSTEANTTNSEYIGLWYMEGCGENELQIYSIDSSTVSFSIFYYGLWNSRVLTASIDSDIAYFCDDEIDGTLTLGEDIIILNVTTSSIPNKPSQYTEIYNTRTSNSTQQNTETSVVEPYVLQINNPSLLIYDSPNYNGSVVSEITDQGKYTIVEEFYDESSKSSWGKLKSGIGWINLQDAIYSSEQTITTQQPTETTTEATTEFIAEATTEIATETLTESTTEVAETTEADNTSETTKELDGVLIEGCIYGCGEEHSITLDGITYHWYDRYEERDYNNTECYDYIDIYSFSVHPTGHSNDINDYDFFYDDHAITYDIFTTGDVSFGWKTYDEDGYYIGVTFARMLSISEKSKGTSTIPNLHYTYYAELYPYGL